MTENFPSRLTELQMDSRDRILRPINEAVNSDIHVVIMAGSRLQVEQAWEYFGFLGINRENEFAHVKSLQDSTPEDWLRVHINTLSIWECHANAE